MLVRFNIHDTLYWSTITMISITYYATVMRMDVYVTKYSISFLKTYVLGKIPSLESYGLDK